MFAQLSTRETSGKAALTRVRGVLRRLYERQELKRLSTLPRYQPTCTRLLGKPVHLADAPSFLVSFYEIFGRQLYRFSPRRERPTILDCGANIGVAILYWKQAFPEAEIVAFEPDPALFDVLVQNCHEWKLDGVQLINRAVWTSQGEMPFWLEGGHSGRLLAAEGVDGQRYVNVGTVRLRRYLHDRIDMLKLDIEGAETKVLLDCADRLHCVDYLFVEYHSFFGQAQRIDELLSILISSGFRIHMHPQLVCPTPFLTHLNVMGMDNTVNVFAFREHNSRTPSPRGKTDARAEASTPHGEGQPG